MEASFKNIAYTNIDSIKYAIIVELTRKPQFNSKYQLFFQEWEYLHLFLSSTITLKTIFNHFQNYIFNRYICIKEHFEKPTILLFKQYPVAPLVLHLAQWRLANEAESLMVIQYATKPRNPE
jgi:hypothetical protein